MKFFTLAFFLLILAPLVIKAQPKSSNSSPNINAQYIIVDKIPLEGDGGWDYLTVDSENARLFVAHSTMVQVIDLNRKKLSGVIHDTQGVHGVAFARDVNKGFTSNGRDSSVTIFNYLNLSTIAKIKVAGSNPDAILYEPITHRVFTFNHGSNNATVIDAISNKVVETIPLSGKPEFAVTDGKGKIYVNIEDKNSISVINAAEMKVEANWPMPSCESPSGLALDNMHHRLFSVCDNKKMVVLNSENGNIITTLPIGDRVDGVVYDPSLKRAYSSNGEGTMTVVQEVNVNTFKVIATVPTQKGARTIAVDSKTNHVYLATAEYLETHSKIKPGSFVLLDIVQLLK